MQKPFITARVSQPLLELIDAWAAYIAGKRQEPQSRSTAIEVAFRNLKVPPDAPALVEAKAAYDASRRIATEEPA